MVVFGSGQSSTWPKGYDGEKLEEKKWRGEEMTKSVKDGEKKGWEK